MNSIHRNRFLSTLAVVAVLILVYAVAHARNRESPPVHVFGHDAAVERTYWVQRIRKVGGLRAYGELARSIASTTIAQQHLQAHLFGDALYQVEGIDGVVVCDERFSQGCFHEFMGQIISHRGIGILPGLGEACAK